MHPHISIITLGVSDMKRSLAFYRDGLGFPLHDFQNDHIAFFTLKGAWLAIHPVHMLAEDANIPYTDIAGFRGMTVAHNVGSESEVDAVMRQAEAAGAVIRQPSRHTDWGGYAGTFTDPDGHAWEIAHNPYFTIE